MGRGSLLDMTMVRGWGKKMRVGFLPGMTYYQSNRVYNDIL